MQMKWGDLIQVRYLNGIDYQLEKGRIFGMIVSR